MIKTCTTKVQAHIRWMIRRDMPEVLRAEQDSFEFPWTEEAFLRCLRERNCIGMVAESGDNVVGFMIYELNKNNLQVLKLAVHPSWRRRGIGRLMVLKLISKLSSKWRHYIVTNVRETNLDAQLFFQSQGFKAVGVSRQYYQDSDEDAYMMRYDYSAWNERA